MPVKIVQETKEKEVGFLEDMDVEFVSLVRHGANQMPFRIIKGEKGGESENMMIVQRILVAKHLKVEDLPRMPGAEWLADADLTKATDKGQYFLAEQADLDLFEAPTLKMVKIHDEGVWALVGGVKGDVDAKNMLALGAEHTKVAKEMGVSPMDAPIPMPAAMQTAVSFRELFFKELDSMRDVVIGTLNQSAGDTTKRKAVVISAVDAFRSFLSIGLDSLGGESAKIEKIEAVRSTKEETEMFKDKAEFEAAVKALVEPLITGVMDAVKGVKDEIAKMAKVEPTPAPAAPPAEPPVVDKTAEALKAVTEQVTALGTKLDEAVKKWDNAPATEPAGTVEPEPKPVTKAQKSVFAGMLTK